MCVCVSVCVSVCVCSFVILEIALFRSLLNPWKERMWVLLIKICGNFANFCNFEVLFLGLCSSS